MQATFSKGIKGGLEELLDNGLAALLGVAAMLALQYGGMGPSWRPCIDIAFFDHEEDSKAMIVVLDNGVGGSGQWGGWFTTRVQDARRNESMSINRRLLMLNR